MDIKYNIIAPFLIAVNCAHSANFGDVFKYVREIVSPDNSMSDKEKVDIAKNAFGVTDETTQKKFLFGFFLDGYEPYSKEEQQLLDNLKKYEWFSSNLTAIYFSGELEKFLQSQYSIKLTEKTQSAIRNFIKLVSDNLDNGYQIDSCRAYHPGLAYLAATGDKRFAFIGKDLNPPIEELVNNTLQKVSNLSVGEKAVFLTGTLIHETRTVVEKTSQDEFDYIVHDSAKRTVIAEKRALKSAEILDKNLWKKLYTEKLSMSQSGSGYGGDNPLIDASSIRSQTKNTCHFRCLYSILKREILSLFTDQDEATIEWSNLKVIFGEWLLLNRASNDENFQLLCTKKQNERKLQLDSIKEIKFLIEIGEYQNLFDLFNQAIGLLSMRYDQKVDYVTSQINGAGKLQRLLAIQSVLVRKM